MSSRCNRCCKENPSTEPNGEHAKKSFAPMLSEQMLCVAKSTSIINIPFAQSSASRAGARLDEMLARMVCARPLQRAQRAGKTACRRAPPPWQVFTVFSVTTRINYLVQLQQEMKKRFECIDFQPAHMPQIIAYANLINNQARLKGNNDLWINFLPWSQHAWLWSEFLDHSSLLLLIVDPPDPPDIPDVSLDEAHAAFTATYLARTECLGRCVCARRCRCCRVCCKRL